MLLVAKMQNFAFNVSSKKSFRKIQVKIEIWILVARETKIWLEVKFENWKLTNSK